MPRITLHTRIANFVNWIRPDEESAEAARKQRDEVRDRIKKKAEDDGLTVRSTPQAGSLATSTGLRRFMRGEVEHEGLDIDCPFVVSPKTEDGDVLKELLGRFHRYAKESYPDTKSEITKSSVRMEFSSSKRNFDLVPMLAVPGTDDLQILLRADGERRKTSVQKHVEFIKKRTGAGQDLRGPVAFNDAIRLLKWWRQHQAASSKQLTEVPTFLISLVSAKSFDLTSLQPKWPETLQRWFDQIQVHAANRKTVSFTDYTPPQPEKLTEQWKVIDPVNGENGAVPSWNGIRIDEFRDWARIARDKVQQAMSFDRNERDADGVALMVDVFGPAFKAHSEAEE